MTTAAMRSAALNQISNGLQLKCTCTLCSAPTMICVTLVYNCEHPC
jgi:hypothetical protein